MSDDTTTPAPETTQEVVTKERLAEMIREAEILIMINSDPATQRLSFRVNARDDDPNLDSPAVMLAWFLQANLDRLIPMALQAAAVEKLASSQPAPALMPDAPTVITGTPRIIGADGPADGEVHIVGPDGKRI